MTTATAEKIETPTIRLIDPARFIEAEYRRNQYVLNLPADFAYDDLFKNESWKRISSLGKVNIGDTIEVRRDDLSLWALLLVRESVTKHSRFVVVELIRKDLEPIKQDESDDAQFEVKHLGLQDGWAVLNKSTQRVMQKDFKDKDAARAYIANSLTIAKVS
jgi:hypothetical protein